MVLLRIGDGMHSPFPGPSRQIKPFVEEQSNKKEYAGMKFVLVSS